MRFRPLIWLKNTVRNRFKDGMVGRTILQARRRVDPERIHLVSATRLDEAAFWKSTALGRSLSIRRSDRRLVLDIAYANAAGLPAVYNAALRRSDPSDAVLFVHDDVWLDDPKWIEKLLLALRRFDVVGVAGNRRRVRDQPAWLFTQGEGDRLLLDGPYLSGSIRHGQQARGEVAGYGPSPAACELLDGVFLAVRNDVVHASSLLFDERFTFHFYDLDFCRAARGSGLSLGTWPIELTHQSGGRFGSPDWKAGLQKYRAKWRH